MAPKKAPPPLPSVVPVPKKAPPPFGPLSGVVRKWLIFAMELQDVAFTYWWEALTEARKLSNALIDINSSYGIALSIRRRH